MSLLGKLFGQSESQKSINNAIFGFLNPTAASHFREGQYLQAYKGWTYACVNAIAEAFSDIELTLQQKTKDGWNDIPDHPSLDLLHKVNRFQSFLDLTYATQAYLELDGNAFWYLPRNGAGVPAEIWYMDPTKVAIVKSEKDFIGGYVFTTEKGTKVPLAVDEVIHFKRFNPWDKHRGIGTVQAAAISIDIDTYASEWQRNFFGNSAMPAGVLSTTGSLTTEQYNRIKDNWNARYQGVQNAHKTALLEGGVTYQSITPSSRDMQFIEGRKAIRDEILGIFRVHPVIVSVTESVNLANAETGEYVFSKFTVKPKMRNFVATLNEFYLPIFKLDSQKYRLHFKDPVPESAEQKRLDIESGIKNYYLTPNEARALNGKEPIDGGDELYIPAGMVPLSQAGTAAQNGTLDDGQDNGGGKGSKAVIVKKKTSGRKVDNPLNREYVDEQVATLHETYLNLNSKLEKQLLKNLKKAKAVDSYIEKLARAVSKDATDELVRLIFENYDDWIGLVYDATKEGLTRVLGQSGKEALTLLEVNGEFDLSHPRVLDWLNEHALEDSDSYSGTIKEDITLKVMEGVETGASNEDIAGNIKQFFDDQSDYRAMRIARTETINAYGAGALEGYRQSGVVEGKYWMPDSEACPICIENADAGVIDIDTDFPSGDPAPSAHPNCECSLGASVAKE